MFSKQRQNVPRNISMMSRASEVVDVPAGFRFKPQDRELIHYYLRPKILNEPTPYMLIQQVEIYNEDRDSNPEIFLGRLKPIVAEPYNKEWYFYTSIESKHNNGKYVNRVSGHGCWKATVADKEIYNKEGTEVIGLKKSLVYNVGGKKIGDWIMREYRVKDADHPNLQVVDKRRKRISIVADGDNSKQNKEIVLCHVYKKPGAANKKATISINDIDHDDQEDADAGGGSSVGHAVVENEAQIHHLNFHTSSNHNLDGEEEDGFNELQRELEEELDEAQFGQELDRYMIHVDDDQAEEAAGGSGSSVCQHIDDETQIHVVDTSNHLDNNGEEDSIGKGQQDEEEFDEAQFCRYLETALAALPKPAVNNNPDDQSGWQEEEEEVMMTNSNDNAGDEEDTINGMGQDGDQYLMMDAAPAGYNINNGRMFAVDDELFNWALIDDDLSDIPLLLMSDQPNNDWIGLNFLDNLEDQNAAVAGQNADRGKRMRNHDEDDQHQEQILHPSKSFRYG